MRRFTRVFSATWSTGNPLVGLATLPARAPAYVRQPQRSIVPGQLALPVRTRACENKTTAMNSPIKSAITPEVIRDHGITPDEYQKILKWLGREPTMTELGIFSVMWSEHCSYKSSRVHLKRLPTRSKLVVQGPGENAGIIDIGDGWACAFKIESHNHPSFIEPFQGAATGVGGILRDIFTMGARPVAVMDSLRFGPSASRAASRPTRRRWPQSLGHGRRRERRRLLRQLLWRAESRR